MLLEISGQTTPETMKRHVRKELSSLTRGQIKQRETRDHGMKENVLAQDGWRGGCDVEDKVVMGKLQPLDPAEQFSLYPLDYQSPAFLAPGAGFVEDNSSTAWGGGWG